MTTETAKPAVADNAAKANGQPVKDGKQQRVISNPNDVASVVLMQIDAVNGKKDELTIAIKGLTDTTKQLVRVYADHAAAIRKLQERIGALEGEGKK